MESTKRAKLSQETPADAAPTPAPALQLVIGNRNYSSWSLRAWLLVRLMKPPEPFKVTVLPMFTTEWANDIQSYCGSRRVPVLLDSGAAAPVPQPPGSTASGLEGVNVAVTVWDSVAIMNHLEDRFPGRTVPWPEGAHNLAFARSIVAEMHSGFLAVREKLPQNIKLIDPVALKAKREGRHVSETDPLSTLDDRKLKEQVGRLIQIFEECIRKSGGPWLFGTIFTVPDVFFAPVALRFLAYGARVPAATDEWMHAIYQHEAVQDWCQDALAETQTITFIDDLHSAATSPLTLG
mmetsp:Transcript_13604/g.49462  ORF Transcript_13604/g.49462 Transcript_13604/m.49462 type:complete len:293 (-) Transcript_13604:52-930(-)